MAGLLTMQAILPFPPSVNHYWRHCHTGTYISKQGKDFRRAVRVALNAQGLAHALDGILSVKVVLCPPNRVRRDLDNFGGKALLDALTQERDRQGRIVWPGMWVDDSQIHELHLTWGPVIRGGQTIVTVRQA